MTAFANHRSLIWIMLAVLLLSWASGASAEGISAGTDFSANLSEPREREIFTVGILGDRTGGAPEDVSILREAVTEMKRLAPDFVITVGDMINGYTHKGGKWLAEAEEWRSIVNDLGCPVMPLCGNHDILGAGGEPSGDIEKRYKSFFGPLYYSFDYKNSHFVVLYSEDGGRSEISAEQIQWLREDLEKDESENVFVFVHRPVWVDNPETWDRLHDLFTENSVRAVFCGHLHTLLKYPTRDGIDYYTIGSTGGYLHKSMEGGGFHQFAQLRVEGDDYVMAVFPLGSALPDDYVLAEDYFEGIDKLDGWSNRETKVLGILSDPTEGPTDDMLPVALANESNKSCVFILTVDPEKGRWEAEPLEVTLASGEKKTVELPVRSPQVDPADFAAPDVLFTYRYTGVRGNMIVDSFVRRAPVHRSVEVPEAETKPSIDGRPDHVWRDSAKIWTTHWTPSEYNPANEEDVRVLLMTQDDDFYFAAKVYDPERCFVDRAPGRKIPGDSVRVAGTDEEGNPRVYLFFPFDPNGRLYRAGEEWGDWEEVEARSVGFECEAAEAGDDYAIEGKIELPALFGDEALGGEERRFNIWLSDDDYTAFPNDRTWAAPYSEETWGTIRFR